jgi:Arc/MetJ-type ribon-helix-helix transcriptional regulator
LDLFILICANDDCMATRRKKQSLSVTLPPEIIEYLEDKVKTREFASMAHGVELCVLRYKEAEERGERP